MLSIPGYRVEAILAETPDGPIHRATPERLGAAPAALRVARVPQGTPRFELRHAAELVASLGHPSLAVVEDIVHLDEDTVAIASTLPVAGTLSERLSRGHLALDEAVPIVRTIAEALASAHELGLYHGAIASDAIGFGDHGPLLLDLPLAATAPTLAHAGRTDVVSLLHLAAGLVDPADASPPAAAYRSLCRWGVDTEPPLDVIVAALGRLGAPPPPPQPCPPPPPPAQAVPTSTDLDARAVAVVVGSALVLGAFLGIAGTLLPVG